MIDIVSVFITFFAVIDPIGTVPVFIAVTRHIAEHERWRVAVRATLTSAAILIFFVVAGELILTVMGIPLSAFQIAGGIVLFLFALDMIFGDSKPEEEVQMVQRGDRVLAPRRPGTLHVRCVRAINRSDRCPATPRRESPQLHPES